MKEAKLKLRILWLPLLALALVACNRSEVPPAAALPDAHLALQQEMEKATMDFSHVVVVRLTSEGKRVEVTSILPAVIAVVQVSGQSAKTIFRVNDAGNALVMFSRDVPHGTSNRTEVSFAELERKKGVVFPVVAADGSLKEREFMLEKIVTPQ
jgi:hypothetical protein